ncbi:MAG: hypothetical protein IT287_08595 [Bdellovibrionaceae bacterium]|nr:hypothetical protein [Pseudobdellovibrionaceae bacterium]
MRTYKNIQLLSLSVLITSLYTSGAGAQELMSNQEIYAKCYAKISDHPVDTNSADYKNVVAKKLDPVEACAKVLDKAMLKSNGTKRELADKNDVVSRAILRNFHQFHLSWFTSLHSTAAHDTLHVFIDNTEPGLVLTDAFFGGNPYSSITTAKKGLSGIRQESAPAVHVVNTTNLTNTILMIGPMKVTAPLPAPINNFFDANEMGKKLSVGPLLGIQDAEKITVPMPGGVARETLTEAQLPSVLYEGTSIDLARHYGGGILGSPSLFLNNVEQYGQMDGGLKVHRRWASNIYYDIMCSSLPNLSDSSAAVKQEHAFFTKQKTDLSFRSNKSCLACHTTIDNLAHVARNVRVNQLVNNNFLRDFRDDKLSTKTARTMYAVYGYKDVKPALEPAAIPSAPDVDPLYHRRTPKGRVVYMDYDSKLVDKPVTGLQEYGEVLAKQNDIYVCAAKRYYLFLTGVDVPLKPIPLDPKTKLPVSKSDTFNHYHRQQVVSLGLKLKTHGSLKTLVSDILKTKTFKARNPAEVGGE